MSSFIRLKVVKSKKTAKIKVSRQAKALITVFLIARALGLKKNTPSKNNVLLGHQKISDELLLNNQL